MNNPIENILIQCYRRYKDKKSTFIGAYNECSKSVIVVENQENNLFVVLKLEDVNTISVHLEESKGLKEKSLKSLECNTLSECFRFIDANLFGGLK